MKNKILIIEDDQSLANILSRRLARHDFESHPCTDASQGLLLARQLKPSHILLDMKLAEHNGLNLITPLRNLLPNSVIVLLTGYASIATAVEAIRLGADNYLAKPVDTQTLLTALTEKSPSQLGSQANQATICEPDEQPLTTKRLEWEHIQQVLNANDGNVSATARQLGMHRRTLQRKLAKKPCAESRSAIA
ncbi:response regulator [Shewanella sp. WXL01]|uniref:response regulator transcription factor n=1 Tax=Shewanella sp. WXL01 TaxID=2709721 RepID=UPI001438383E|nr:response regulator [Shewanella sp. WXL01]NKF52756.1 response regulator [Shewanella sp. WXL01]